MSDTWAILLAAGESSRMGQLKALLPWRGATLIEHQVASLFEGGVDRIVVVVGHEADRLVLLLKACRKPAGDIPRIAATTWSGLATPITCWARRLPSRQDYPP